jgi:hypothetical protein
MSNDLTNSSKFIFYTSNVGNINIQVFVENDTVWTTQKGMADIFSTSRENITVHLKNIFQSEELQENLVCKKILHTAIDGKKYNTNYYNLDAIIAVGYRVNSKQATQFRIWATNILKEYLIKGFALDDDRLKQGSALFGKDYFRELLERVRSIRANERRIWQQITDIFAECSIDYDRDSSITEDFYATMQNKFHYAITGQTAAEIIYIKANKNSNNMGLITWKNSPNGRILKTDVTIAKNYLSEKEIRQLERAVSGYFDYIEDLIERENTFTMDEFSKSINEFLAFRKYNILKDKGKISKKRAYDKAKAEYDEFNKTQKIISDFDKIIDRLKVKSKLPK